MKRFLLFLSVVFLGLGIAVAAESPYTFTYTSGLAQWKNNQPTTINGVAWTFSTNASSPYFGGGERGFQFGKGGANVVPFTITAPGNNDVFGGASITEIKVKASSGNANVVNISVSVGGTAFLRNGSATATLTTASTEYTFTGEAVAGDVAISYTMVNGKTTTKASYLEAITIVYKNAGPKDYEQTFADMTLEVGESKVIDLGEEHPETFVIDAEDAAIAEVVEAEGVFTITGKAVGTTKVSVMWDGEGWNEGSDEFTVTVNPVLPAPELSFDKAEITEYIGSLEQDLPVLTATEGLKITYSSSNEVAATIDAQTGAVELVAAGTTTITASSEATAEYKAGEASYILNVKAAPTGGYTLLTNINDLVDGTVGVIATKDGKEALGAYNSSKSRFDGATVAFSDDMKSLTWDSNADVIEFTFTQVEGGYNIGNGENYISASGSTDLKYSTTSDVATIALDENYDADICFNTTNMILYNKNQNINVFKHYAASNKGNANYATVQIYVAQPAAEVVVPNMVVDGEENAEPVIVFHEGMTIHFNIPEGVRVYRRFVATEEPATPAPARVTGEDGNEYERHTEAYTVPGYGTLSYFAESQGVRSAVKEVRVSDTTGVEDITVGAEEGEAVYYDMTGRRVANPTAGLYIRVNGTTATKVYLR